MKLLLVTFALQGSPDNYEQFFVTLRGSALQWWHFIAQTCVVAANFSADEFARRLVPHIDQTRDFLLVTEIKPHQFQGWLPKVAWDWFNQVSTALEPQRAQHLPPLVPPLKLPR